MIDVKEYEDSEGRSPFGRWFDRLGYEAAARVSTSVIRIGQGNLSSAKGVGAGVWEYRINFGPGYRVYFGRDGEKVVILLGGGTKKRQQNDIDTAKAHWRDYKQRKKKEN